MKYVLELEIKSLTITRVTVFKACRQSLDYLQCFDLVLGRKTLQRKIYSFFFKTQWLLSIFLSHTHTHPPTHQLRPFSLMNFSYQSVSFGSGWYDFFSGFCYYYQYFFVCSTQNVSMLWFSSHSVLSLQWCKTKNIRLLQDIMTLYRLEEHYRQHGKEILYWFLYINVKWIIFICLPLDKFLDTFCWHIGDKNCC